MNELLVCTVLIPITTGIACLWVIRAIFIVRGEILAKLNAIIEYHHIREGD